MKNKIDIKEFDKMLSAVFDTAEKVETFCTVHPTSGPIHNSYVTFKLVLQKNLTDEITPDSVEGEIERVFDSCQRVQSLICEYKKKVEEQERTIDILSKENARLGKFETHFSLEFQLRHGNEIDSGHSPRLSNQPERKK